MFPSASQDIRVLSHALSSWHWICQPQLCFVWLTFRGTDHFFTTSLGHLLGRVCHNTHGVSMSQHVWGVCVSQHADTGQTVFFLNLLCDLYWNTFFCRPAREACIHEGQTSVTSKNEEFDGSKRWNSSSVFFMAVRKMHATSSSEQHKVK